MLTIIQTSKNYQAKLVLYVSRGKIKVVLATAVDTIMQNHTYKLGDEFYLKTEGAPIGLYKQEVIKNEIIMLMFGRFVDNRNELQGPRARARRGRDRGFQRQAPVHCRRPHGRDRDGGDLLLNHPNKKLPILNMLVWIEYGVLYYEHYDSDNTEAS